MCGELAPVNTPESADLCQTCHDGWYLLPDNIAD
jgi:hypothetical protein